MSTLKLDHLLSTSASSTSNTTTTTTTSNTTSSFSSSSSIIRRFPAEIRNKIYGFSFPTNTTIYPAFSVFGHPTSHEDGTTTILSLACTCREIRAEVIPMYFASNMFSFSWSCQMYRFMVNIGKEGRQALRQLEFVWDYSHPKNHLSVLRDCVNLQRLHIGLGHFMIDDLRAINKKKTKNQKMDIWEWMGQGEYTSELLRQLPRDLELKIREVNSFQDSDAQISSFFKGPIKLIRPNLKNDGIVEKFEAELKENLRCLREGRCRVATERQMKRRKV